MPISTGRSPNNGISACFSSDVICGFDHVNTGRYAALARLIALRKPFSPVTPTDAALPSVNALA